MLMKTRFQAGHPPKDTVSCPGGYTRRSGFSRWRDPMFHQHHTSGLQGHWLAPSRTRAAANVDGAGQTGDDDRGLTLAGRHGGVG